MTTKLTLTIDNAVIHSAKKYARQNGKSLSDIVENYLKTISSQNDASPKLAPKVAKLMGSISLPDDFNYKEELSRELVKKYR